MSESRGVKRKRTSAPTEDEIARKVKGKLHSEAAKIRASVKIAKSVETRKVIKKLKSLRAKEPGHESIKDLEIELETYKHMSHVKLANLAFKTKLNKERRLVRHNNIQDAVTAELPSDLPVLSKEGTPARKAEDRLLSSKLLAAELKKSVVALIEICDPEAKKKALTFVLGTPDDQEQPRKTKRKESHPSDSAEESENDSQPEDDAPSDADEQGWESGSVRDDSEEDDGWESGSVDDAGAQVSAESSDSGEGSSPDDDRLLAKAPSKIKASNVSKAKDAPAAGSSKARATAESTFLPSLSVGFTRGDSDASDISDAEANVADGVRKNRRGQRARRAIWEKKYGKHANHIKKEREAAARDPRRSKQAKFNPKDHSRDTRPPQAGARPAFSAPPIDKDWSKNRSPAAATHSSAKPPQKRDDKPLHPSWEAKRRLKEKLNPSIVPAQGKKITF
ncbi:Bud-site selection protein [Wolfiporia cocos MD-104 SS10]|uniref:Bud-site selection protein n=1 Tax=Wolfiporia cocos (strain MD-104) TaxID=742152 RepID=A0A2H3JEX3_WOLCO|nr:Bud-site selection protein [Wolfiporia cocos MD-104 SS10]